MANYSLMLSGLQNTAKALDTVGNNIANANTVGYKAGEYVFADQFARAVSPRDAARTGMGTDSLGVRRPNIQGTVVNSENPLDLAISGNGLFRLIRPSAANGGGVDPSSVFYTRNGQFRQDNQGYIVNENGMYLTGYQPVDNGRAIGDDYGANYGRLRMPPANIEGRETTTSRVSALLDNRATAFTKSANVAFDPTQATYNNKTSQTVYDEQGFQHTLEVYYRRISDNYPSKFSIEASSSGLTYSPTASASPNTLGTTAVTINPTSSIAVNTPAIEYNIMTAKPTSTTVTLKNTPTASVQADQRVWVNGRDTGLKVDSISGNTLTLSGSIDNFYSSGAAISFYPQYESTSAGFNFEAKAWNETNKSLTLGNRLKRSTTGAELLTNGGFESSGNFGWTVVGGIDVLSSNDPGWPNRIPAEGTKFIDLNSVVTGAIKQTIQTTPGESYRLSFSHGGNGEWRSAIGQTIADPIKSIQLTVDGEDKGIYSVDTSDPKIPLKTWGWRQASVDFIASGTSTEISFSSLETGVFGPALDGISLKKLDSGNADLASDRNLTGYRAFVKEDSGWVDTGCQVLQHTSGSAVVQLDREYLVNGVNGFIGNKQIEFRSTLDFTLTTPNGQSFAVQGASNNPTLFASATTAQKLLAAKQSVEVYASLDGKFFGKDDGYTTNRKLSPQTDALVNGYKPVAIMDFVDGKNIDSLIPETGSANPMFRTDSTLTGKVSYQGGASGTLTVKLDLTDTSMDATSFQVNSSVQDGEASARLSSISVDNQGRIAGVYGSGMLRYVGQVALVHFDNFEGLAPVGQNALAPTVFSGVEGAKEGVIVGRAGTGLFGDIKSQALESSTVDLSTELVRLMVLQRTYTSNSQGLRAQDQTLRDLIQVLG